MPSAPPPPGNLFPADLLAALSTLRELERLATEQGLVEEAERLDLLRRRPTRGRLRVVIVGGLATGKSRLHQALCRWAPWPDIEWVDSPAFDEHRQAVLSLLDGADAAFFLISALAPLSALEQRFLTQEVAKRDIGHLTLMLTQIDRLHRLEDAERLATWLRARLGELDLQGLAPNLLPIVLPGIEEKEAPAALLELLRPVFQSSVATLRLRQATRSVWLASRRLRQHFDDTPALVPRTPGENAEDLGRSLLRELAELGRDAAQAIPGAAQVYEHHEGWREELAAAGIEALDSALVEDPDLRDVQALEMDLASRLNEALHQRHHLVCRRLLYTVDDEEERIRGRLDQLAATLADVCRRRGLEIPLSARPGALMTAEAVVERTPALVFSYRPLPEEAGLGSQLGTVISWGFFGLLGGLLAGLGVVRSRFAAGLEPGVKSRFERLRSSTFESFRQRQRRLLLRALDQGLSRATFDASLGQTLQQRRRKARQSLFDRAIELHESLLELIRELESRADLAIRELEQDVRDRRQLDERLARIEDQSRQDLDRLGQSW